MTTSTAVLATGMPDDLGILRCYFCGADRSTTVPLFQGPGLSICSYCTCTAANYFLEIGAITDVATLPDCIRPPNEEL